jgi:hypothetical protein
MLLDDSYQPPPFSNQRIKHDLCQIDGLGELINQLAIPFDLNMAEVFQKLTELAGSKEFLPVYANIHHYLSKLKWARDGSWESGYIVSWINIYSSFNNRDTPCNELQSIANHAASSSKSPLVKSPINTYGRGFRPVELNREDWNAMIQSTLACGLKEIHSSRSNKRTQQAPQYGRKSTVSSQPSQVPIQIQASYQEIGSIEKPKKRPSISESVEDAIMPTISLATSSIPPTVEPVQMTIQFKKKNSKKQRLNKPVVLSTPQTTGMPTTKSTNYSSAQFAPAADFK